MKKEVNSVLGIIIIVIVSALICFLTMFIVDDKKDVNESNPSNDKNTAEKNEVKYEKIENIDVIAKEFFNNYVEKMMFANYDVLFKDNMKLVNISELSYNTKMSLILNITLRTQNSGWVYLNDNVGTAEINAEKIRDIYLHLYGSNGYLEETFANVSWCKCPQSVNYIKDTDKYRAISGVCGCGIGGYSEKYLYERAEQSDDKIKLYVNVGYIGTVDTDLAHLFSDYARTNKIAEIKIDSDISSYKEKLGLLCYTLVKDTNTNNYVLESIEVVK